MDKKALDAFDKASLHSQVVSDYFSEGDIHSLTVNLLPASSVKVRPVEWLWNGWLARGKLHVFAGTAGTGKTTIALGLAAIVSTGGRFPDGTLCPKGSVLIWSGEDAIDDTLVPRLIASGADLSKIHFIRDTTLANFEKGSFDPATHVDALARAAHDMPDLGLLILDPIVNAVAGDSHKNGEVRRALQPVVEFGERLNCAVLGITHFSKGTQGKDPLERVTGSLAFGALARVVLATARVKEWDNTRRIFCRAKSNIGDDSGGFEYGLTQSDIGNAIFASHILWGEAIEGSARELLAEPDSYDEGTDCAQLIAELLAGGRMPAKEVERECEKAGFNKNQVRRAREKLKIKPHREGYGAGSISFWDLPAYMAKNTIVGTHGEQNSMPTMPPMMDKNAERLVI